MIVLDPGHGGVDAGAIGPGGAVEKTIVFEFTRELAQKLEASGHYHVVMTRDGDEFVSLADRVKIARDVNAALLISIHADTLQAAAECFRRDGLHRRRPGVGRRGGAHRRARKRRRPGRRSRAEAGGGRRRRHSVRSQAARNARLRPSLFARRGRRMARRRPAQSQPRAFGGLHGAEGARFPLGPAGARLSLKPAGREILDIAEWRAKATSALASAVDRFFIPRADGVARDAQSRGQRERGRRVGRRGLALSSAAVVVKRSRRSTARRLAIASGRWPKFAALATQIDAPTLPSYGFWVSCGPTVEP